MAYSTACSKSWTDVNVDFKRGTIGHCCKSVYYDFPDEYTSEFDVHTTTTIATGGQTGSAKVDEGDSWEKH